MSRESRRLFAVVTRKGVWSAFFAVLPVLIGCSSSPPATVPVSGVVTYQGKTVKGATVSFSRGTGDRAKGEFGVATTDANGRYELKMHFDGTTSATGAVPGEYKVTVSKPAPPSGMTEAKYQALVDEADKAGAQGITLPPEKLPPPPVEFFPPRISAPDRTKLTVTVEKGKSEYNLNLE